MFHNLDSHWNFGCSEEVISLLQDRPKVRDDGNSSRNKMKGLIHSYCQGASVWNIIERVQVLEYVRLTSIELGILD